MEAYRIVMDQDINLDLLLFYILPYMVCTRTYINLTYHIQYIYMYVYIPNIQCVLNY